MLWSHPDSRVIFILFLQTQNYKPPHLVWITQVACMAYCYNDTIKFLKWLKSKQERQSVQKKNRNDNQFKKKKEQKRLYIYLWFKSSMLLLSEKLFFLGSKDILNQRFLHRQQLRELHFQLRNINLSATVIWEIGIGLFLSWEISPLESRVNIVFVHLQDLIEGHHSRIWQVPQTLEVSLGHFYGDWNEFVQNSDVICDVGHFAWFDNLIDEVVWIVQIRWYWYSQFQSAHILIVLQQIFNLMPHINRCLYISKYIRSWQPHKSVFKHILRLTLSVLTYSSSGFLYK